MARVKRYLDVRASDNHDRWLVSYGDFITLLFAFFVVMYALSSLNESKYRAAGQAIGSAFRIVETGTGTSSVQMMHNQSSPQAAQTRTAAVRHRERISELRQSLGAALAPLAADGDIRFVQHARGLTVEIGAGALFASGQAVLREEARTALVAVAALLRAGETPLEVEGHTDNVPIKSQQFPSNWELSGARASSVVRLLIENGVSPVRFAAIGFGEFRPVESNATLEGRQRNRRVSITVVDPLPATAPALATGNRPVHIAPPAEFPIVTP